MPTSSLRGLISFLAEALRNSTLRVRDNPHYLVRSGIREQTGASLDRGILRVPGKHNPCREAHLPNTKKHEQFVSVPD